MKFLPFLFLFVSSFAAKAQTYTDSILTYRQHYKEEFLTDAHSPLKAADTGFLRFYAPDPRYRVTASFTPTPDAKPFDIGTHSGKKKPYRQYGTLSFTLRGKPLTLQVYQGMDLMKQKGLEDYLFIPFNDLTNYGTTYGGGRYLDLKTGDIIAGKVVLDFNKCYNPYCAFAGGYSCPIPPDANKMKVSVEAGEQSFGREVKE